MRQMRPRQHGQEFCDLPLREPRAVEQRRETRISRGRTALEEIALGQGGLRQAEGLQVAALARCRDTLLQVPGGLLLRRLGQAQAAELPRRHLLI